MVMIGGARHKIDNPDAILKHIMKISARAGITIQVFDASKIRGREHLEIAAEKARRAFVDGRNLSNTLATEVMLYAAAERQISKAIGKVGIRPGIDKLAIVVFGDVDKSELFAELGWQEDETAIGPPPQDELNSTIENMALSELER